MSCCDAGPTWALTEWCWPRACHQRAVASCLLASPGTAPDVAAQVLPCSGECGRSMLHTCTCWQPSEYFALHSRAALSSSESTSAMRTCQLSPAATVPAMCSRSRRLKQQPTDFHVYPGSSPRRGAPVPTNEAARQAAVRTLGLHRAAPDSELDRLCAFTCRVLRVPAAGGHRLGPASVMSGYHCAILQHSAVQFALEQPALPGRTCELQGRASW